MKSYINIIDTSTKENIGLEHIISFCHIFKLIYEEKKEIKKEDIKNLIRSIKKAIESTDILDNKLSKHFFAKLNEIYLNNNAINNNNIIDIDNNVANNNIKEYNNNVANNNIKENNNNITNNSNHNMSQNNNIINNNIKNNDDNTDFNDNIKIHNNINISQQIQIAFDGGKRNNNKMQIKQDLNLNDEKKHSNDQKVGNKNNFNKIISDENKEKNLIKIGQLLIKKEEQKKKRKSKLNFNNYLEKYKTSTLKRNIQNQRSNEANESPQKPTITEKDNLENGIDYNKNKKMKINGKEYSLKIEEINE